MAGAAADRFCWQLQSQKSANQADVLKEYASRNGRSRVTLKIVSGLKVEIRQSFEAALQVLHYWRDDAAHGMATTISEVEAYASLTQLLFRLAQFCLQTIGRS